MWQAAFWIGVGAWLVLTLLFQWAIERRLAELVAIHRERPKP